MRKFSRVRLFWRCGPPPQTKQQVINPLFWGHKAGTSSTNNSLSGFKRKPLCPEFNTSVEAYSHTKAAAEGADFSMTVLICKINADYLSVDSGSFVLRGKGGVVGFATPWGSSVKCKQEAFEPERLVPAVNPSVSDRGHRSCTQLHG